MRRRKRKTVKLPKGIDSKLELDLKEGSLRNCSWKPDPIDYIIRKKYNPDCQYGNVIIEIKGRFRTSEEARKYVWVRKHLQEGQELVFVFSNPKCKMPNAKKRKDGTYHTHAEWADKNNFVWYSKDDTPKAWADPDYHKRRGKKT